MSFGVLQVRKVLKGAVESLPISPGQRRLSAFHRNPTEIDPSFTFPDTSYLLPTQRSRVDFAIGWRNHQTGSY